MNSRDAESNPTPANSGIFVDTGAWFSATVPSDTKHPAAAGWLSHNTLTLVTTDFIADEVLTLLRAHGEADAALRLSEQLFNIPH
ncbi:MAG: hypothetical protein M3014_03225 [Chloroflexota bacterium]|nr:hypothetical protein [Chloroflexota bacterium]